MSAKHWALNRKRWAVVRVEALNAAGWRCADCGRAGALQVHHKKALTKGGAPYDLANLRAVCRGCHRAAHKHTLAPALQRWADLVNSPLGAIKH